MTSYFVFKVLPFGLSSTCYLFTRMFRPFVYRWRSFGIMALLYIDDGIFACRTDKTRSVESKSSGKGRFDGGL